MVVYFIKSQQQVFNLILQRDPCISLMRRWLFPMGWCTLQQCTCVNGFKSWPYSRIERGELKFHLGFESSIGQKSTKALPKSLNTEIGYMIYIKCMQLILVLRNKKTVTKQSVSNMIPFYSPFCFSLTGFYKCFKWRK